MIEDFKSLANKSGMTAIQLTESHWRVTHPLRRWPLNIYYSAKRQSYTMAMELPKTGKEPFAPEAAVKLLMGQPKLRKPYAHLIPNPNVPKPEYSAMRMSGRNMWDFLCKEMRSKRKWIPPDWALSHD